MIKLLITTVGIILVSVFIVYVILSELSLTGKVRGTITCYSNGTKIYEGPYTSFWGNGIVEAPEGIFIRNATCVAKRKV